MAKHRRLNRRRPTLRRRSFVAMVDVRSLLVHLMTPDAAAEGLRGRYIALCGADVIPASFTEPGQGRCEPCVRTKTVIRVGAATCE